MPAFVIMRCMFVSWVFDKNYCFHDMKELVFFPVKIMMRGALARMQLNTLKEKSSPGFSSFNRKSKNFRTEQ